MPAKMGDTVAVHYIGKLEDGEVFDTSSKREPVRFTIGAGEVLKGLEEGVVGMNPGELKTSRVVSDKGFGPHLDEMVATVERHRLPQDLKPEVGQVLRAGSENESVPVRVVEVSDEMVTLDANHPLAGRDFILEIKLEEIVRSE